MSLSESEKQELLDVFRRAMALRPWHRLLFLFASCGAGFWCLGPVFWEQDPPWWFVLSFLPIVAYAGPILSRKARVLKDDRFLAFKSAPMQLISADLRLIWPTPEEARVSSWQRPVVVLGWTILTVCAVVGLAVLIPRIMG